MVYSPIGSTCTVECCGLMLVLVKKISNQFNYSVYGFLPNSLPALDLGSICLAWYVQGFHLYYYTIPMMEEQTLFENNNQRRFKKNAAVNVF